MGPHRHVRRAAAERPHRRTVLPDLQLDQGTRPERAGERGDDDPARPHLPQQRVRHVPHRAGGDQPVHRPQPRPRLLTVPDPQVGTVPDLGQGLRCLRGHHRVQLDAVDQVVPEPLAEQGGDVARAGPHLQHPRPVLHPEQPEHPGRHRGHGVRRRGDTGSAFGPVVELRDHRLVAVHQRQPLVRLHDRYTPVRQLTPGPLRYEPAAGYGLEHPPPPSGEQPPVGQILYQGRVRGGLSSGAHGCGAHLGRLPSGDGFGSEGGVHGLSDGGPACLPPSASPEVAVIVHLLCLFAVLRFRGGGDGRSHTAERRRRDAGSRPRHTRGTEDPALERCVVRP